MTKRKSKLAEVQAIPTSREVIDLLEEALAEARTGTVLAVACVLVRTQGVIDTKFSADHHHALVAGMTYMQHDISGGSRGE